MIAAPATPAPTAMPRVSISSVGDSSRASAPASALAITASGITGKAVPIPKPAAIHATTISHNGDPWSTSVVTPTPIEEDQRPDPHEPSVRPAADRV